MLLFLEFTDLPETEGFFLFQLELYRIWCNFARRITKFTFWLDYISAILILWFFDIYEKSSLDYWNQFSPKKTCYQLKNLQFFVLLKVVVSTLIGIFLVIILKVNANRIIFLQKLIFGLNNAVIFFSIFCGRKLFENYQNF